MSRALPLVLTAALLLGCGKDSQDVKDAPQPPPKKEWPWKPFTAAKLLEDGPMGGPHVGWNPDDNTFGLCQWECENRVSDFTLECYVGRPGEFDARLAGDTSKEDFVRAGILATPAGDARQPFGDVTLSTRFKSFDNDARCEWKLIATNAAGKQKILTTGEMTEGCFDAPEFHPYVSPDRKAFALWVEHAGDHGCGGNDVLVITPPTAL